MPAEAQGAGGDPTVLAQVIAGYEAQTTSRASSSSKRPKNASTKRVTVVAKASPISRQRSFALSEAEKIRKPEDFAVVLLTYMGLPVNAKNVKALLQWQSSEGTFPVPARHYAGAVTPAISGYHNPLNTGFLYAGSGPKTANSSRPNNAAAEYPSWKVGIEATAYSISEHQYAPILDILKRSEGGKALQTAVVRSSWGTKIWSSRPVAPYTYSPVGKSPFRYRS